MKFYQLIARLFVILPQLNETKLKLKYLKSGFKCKKKDKDTDKKFFASIEFSSSLLLEYNRNSYEYKERFPLICKKRVVYITCLGKQVAYHISCP